MATAADQPNRTGPLAGIKVIEMAGLGPVPFAGLMLSEMGADVLRIERKQTGRAFLAPPPEFDIDRYGRGIVALDLKQPEAVALLGDLVAGADVLIEGFRPGVMERLGIGPDAALARNPALIYGRMTGFGQDGPLAGRAGHDLTYLAYTGLLHAIGHRGERPVPPLNMIADYGGGAMFLIAGILAALFERSRSGKGQVIDAAMVDGASALTLPIHAFLAAGLWHDRRGVNLLDSGAPFYDTYETSDGGHMAVACLEPQFFAEFARLLPLDPAFVQAQYSVSGWPDMRVAIAARFHERTRDEWAAHFEASDACVAPVLSFAEAHRHPHNRARGVHVTAGVLERPAPAPRLSRTPLAVAAPTEPAPPADIMERFGIARDETDRLVRDGIVGQ